MKGTSCGKDNRVKARLFPIPIFITTFLLSGAFTTLQIYIISDYLDYEHFPFYLRILVMAHWIVAAAGITLWMYYLLKYRYQKPIEKFAGAAQKVAKGDFSVYIRPKHTVDRADYLDIIFMDFNKMVEELGSIETLKVDFFANVSHEMKTPLSAIQSYAEMLQNPSLPEERRKEYTSAILEHTHRMSSLISNMLKLNKLESQKIQPEPVRYDLCGQLGECAVGFEQIWEKKKIDFEVDMEDRSYITADKSLMEMVWNNLLSNAFKFTKPGGSVKLTQQSDEQWVIVSVSDNGCGMDKETIKHIFDKFYQGDTSHSTEGNGLGLALVLQILRQSGGTIAVESEEDRGSIFTVKIPRSKAVEEQDE